MSSAGDEVFQDLYADAVAGIKALPQNVAMGDVMADGEWRLICAEVSSRLKVFKGKVLQTEARLQMTPVAVTPFYSYDANSRTCIPLLAVAGGSYLFIYKYLKGTFKFLIPNADPLAEELSVWEELREAKCDNTEGLKRLAEFEDRKADLSPRTLEFLSLTNGNDRLNFVEERKSVKLVVSNFVTCLTAIKKNNPAYPQAENMLIVGTELGYVYVINQSQNKLLTKFKLPVVPFQIVAVGAYDIDYRIHVAGRGNSLYTIKNGEQTTIVIQISSKIFSFVKTDKSFLICSVDSAYHSFNTRGTKNFTLKLPAPVTAMCELNCKVSRNFEGVLIALKNLEVRLYEEKLLVNVFKVSQPVMSMKFGKFSKEEELLVLISNSGALQVKGLKDVNLNKVVHKEKTSIQETGVLYVPKKTKLYLELIEREKAMGSDMNQVFQNDLLRLRHKTLDTFVKMLKVGHAPQNYSTTSNVKLSASLQGLGPTFKLHITVDNTGDEVISCKDLIVDYDRKVFDFDRGSLQLGLLMPNVPTKYCFNFKNVSESGTSGNVKVQVLDKTLSTPLVSSTIKVPISELETY